MKNFVQRSITGIVFVSVIIGSILLSNILFGVLMGVVSILGMWEFYTISTNDDIKPNKILGIVIGILTYSLIFLIALNILKFKVFLFIIPLLFITTIFELYRNKPNALLNIAVTIFGVLYVAIPLSMMNFLFSIDGEFSANGYLLLGFFALLWSNDTFAYLFGMSLGKRRLFERISPKKSWEGFIGGMLSTIGISILLSRFFDQLVLWQWVGMALVIVCFGTFGDLVESLLKRSLNIKDSGTILPGHGGILDRFDAVLIAAPFVISYLFLILHS